MQAKETLLLHVCCAPCATYPISELQDTFDLTLFFYNPNIYPEQEYRLREQEIKQFSQQCNLPLILGSYDLFDFEAAIAGRETLGEGSDRCLECFRLRFEVTARWCHELSIIWFTSTLSISPHKRTSQINQVGSRIAQKYQIHYYQADFKKKDGFAKSIRMSQAAGMYRQSYCGCYHSYREMQQRRNRVSSRTKRDQECRV